MPSEPLPPLSPLDARVEELRTWLREEGSLSGPQAWRTVLSDPWWTALKPFVIEALHFYRLARRELGDPRPLPEER